MEPQRLKKAVILSAVALISALSFSACGGSSSNSSTTTTTPTSKLAKRVYVLNQFQGKIQIVDAANDVLSNFTVPTDILGFFVTGDSLVRAGSKTLVVDTGANLLHEIDDVKEDRIAAVALDAFTESVVVTSDGATAYAAIPSLGRIDVIDLAAGKQLDPINGIPGVRRLALTKNNGKLLAFSNDVNTLVVVNTSDKTLSAPIAGFDRPYTALFSSDDTKAFVLSCGVECGGKAANVTVLDLSSNTLGSSVVVGGATVGLLDGNNLYVAGSPAASTASSNGGTLNVVNVANTAALTASSNIAISDGLHHTIVAVGSGKLYIGAKRCTVINNPPVNKGCLSIFNTSASTAVVGAARGEVTSIAAIKNRTVVYITQGGDLDIYDSATDALQTKQIDISGKVVDAKEVD